jgi:diketogulonate reductase-like aldo/keto reductase
MWRKGTLDYFRNQGIAIVAYKPFGGGGAPVLRLEEVRRIAHRHGVPPSHVALSFLTQQGIAVVTKSKNPARMRQNLEGASGMAFRLSASELDALRAISGDKVEEAYKAHFEKRCNQHYPPSAAFDSWGSDVDRGPIQGETKDAARL